MVCQVRIKVIVLDTNDHGPDFTQDEYSFYIPDDYVSGNAIGNVKVCFVCLNCCLTSELTAMVISGRCLRFIELLP